MKPKNELMVILMFLSLLHVFGFQLHATKYVTDFKRVNILYTVGISSGGSGEGFEHIKYSGTDIFIRIHGYLGCSSVYNSFTTGFHGSTNKRFQKFSNIHYYGQHSPQLLWVGSWELVYNLFLLFLLWDLSVL